MRGFAPGFNGNARPPGTGVNSPLNPQGHTALHLAVQKNDREALEKLLRVNANPNQQDKEGQTALFEAITARNTEFVKMLVEKGASFDLRDDKKRSALDWAIEKECNVEFIASLKALGADPSQPAADNRRTAMHLAAEKNRPDLIAYLHSTGISMNQQDINGATPLHIAIANKSMDALNKLIELKADANIRNNQIETPLYAAAQSGNVAAAEALLTLPEVRRSINDHRNYGSGYTPLMAAVAANQPKIIEAIVAVGGNVNQTDNQNRNSLYIAVENGNVDAARLLIRLGSDTGKSDVAGYNRSSMVHVINDKNYSEMLILLHNAGFDLNARDSSGVTALNRAAEQGNKTKMKALLDLGADPNVSNDYGRRPLDTILDNYTYSYTEQKETIALLVSKGADVGMSQHPQMQFSPLHLAARNGKIDDMKLLIAHGAPIEQHARMPGGMTPFLTAVESGKAEAAQLLKDNGADVFAKDDFKRGAIIFAARSGSDKTLDALLAIPGMEKHIDDQDNKGRTAAHDAFRKYHNDTGVALIKRGARLDLYDNEGQTALHQAIATSYMADFLDGVKAALGDKADWNLRMKDNGDTLLHVAAKHSQAPVIDKLLEFGADASLPGKDGLLPVHTAMLLDNENITTKLLESMKAKGQSVDAQRDKNGWGSLHYAAIRDSGSFTQLVLDAGADVNATSIDGDTALHVATRAGKSSAALTLLARGADPLAENKQGQTALDVAMAMKRVDIAQAILSAMQQKAATPAAKPWSGITPPKPFKPS